MLLDDPNFWPDFHSPAVGYLSLLISIHRMLIQMLVKARPLRLTGPYLVTSRLPAETSRAGASLRNISGVHMNCRFQCSLVEQKLRSLEVGIFCPRIAARLLEEAGPMCRYD